MMSKGIDSVPKGVLSSNNTNQANTIQHANDCQVLKGGTPPSTNSIQKTLYVRQKPERTEISI